MVINLMTEDMFINQNIDLPIHSYTVLDLPGSTMNLN